MFDLTSFNVMKRVVFLKKFKCEQKKELLTEKRFKWYLQTYNLILNFKIK